MRIKNKKISGKKWIFFDLDGTLADTIPALYHTYLNFLKKFNKTGTKAEFAQLSGPSLPEIVAALKSKYGLKPSNRALLKVYRDEIAQFYRNAKPFSGADDILEKFSKLGFKLMLVTSGNQRIASEFVTGQEWQKYFQNYVFGNEVKKAKPDPSIYNLALQKAGILSDEAVSIEDSPNGIRSAKGAGILTIGITNNETRGILSKAGADIVISKLKDILTFFK